MNNKKLYVFTFIVFSISILLSLLFIVFSILSIIIVKAIPPFIFLLIFSGLIILLTLHCYKCVKYTNMSNRFGVPTLRKLSNVTLYYRLYSVYARQLCLVYCFSR